MRRALQGRLSILKVISLFALVTGCGGRGPVVRAPSDMGGMGLKSGATLSDAQFGQTLEFLLTADPKSVDRTRALEAVLQKQFAHASYRFRSRNANAGATKLSGAFALLRAGELRDSVLGPPGIAALQEGAREYSRRGDEGRAEAAFSILSKNGSEDTQKDAREHAAAIAAWNLSFLQSGGLAGAGAIANSSVSRYLNEVSEASRLQALSRTQQWLAQAVNVRDVFRSTSVVPPRAEGMEAQRALAFAPLMIACLHLRNYDANAALVSLENGDARTPAFLRALSTALLALRKNATSENWLGVARALRGGSAGRENADEAENEETELVKSASFSAALEAHRLDPANPYAAIEVSIRLREFGFASAAPSVLTAAAAQEGNREDPQFLQTALAVMLACIKTEAQEDNVEGARLAYRNGKPLLDLASKAKAQPLEMSMRVFQLMGELELQDGDLNQAVLALGAAAATGAQPSSSVMVSLGRIQMHRGNLDDAIARFERAKVSERRTSARSEILVHVSEAYRLKKNAKAAREALLEALAIQKSEPESVQLECIKANILHRFGADALSKRSLLLALERASRDTTLLSAVTEQAVALALVTRDLEFARSVFAKSLENDASSTHLVYAALWSRLLERTLKATPDASVTRVLSAAKDDARWVGTMASFGLGLLSVEQMLGKAMSPAQRTEAYFYAAMERRVRQVPGDQELLSQSVSAGGLELVEYGLAKEFLAPRDQVSLGALPEGL
jgi:cellulose synthase operon protein C